MITPKLKSKLKRKRRMKATEAGDWAAGSKQYRCSLQCMFATFQDIRKKIKPPHIECMARTPFHLLFKGLLEDSVIKSRKKDANLDCIIKNYIPSEDAFRFGRSYGKLHKSDVKLVFGINDGSEKIEFSKRVTATSDFTDRLFPGKQKISGAMIKKILPAVCERKDKRSVEDTVRLLCLLLIDTCFLPTTGTFLATGYFPYLDNIDNIKLYDWSGEILSLLRNSLKKNSNDPRTVRGCTLFLLFWFCEHFTTLEPKNRNFPRCARWDLKEIAGKITAANLKNMSRSQFTTKELNPSMREIIDLGLRIIDYESRSSDGTEEQSEESSSDFQQENHEEEAQQVDHDDESLEAQPEEEEKAHQADYEDYPYMTEEQHPTEAKEADPGFEKLRESNFNSGKVVERLNAKLTSAKNQVGDLTAQLAKSYASRADLNFESKELTEVNLQLHIQQLQQENQELVERTEGLVATAKALEDDRQLLSTYAEQVTTHVTDMKKTYDRKIADMQNHTEMFDKLKREHKMYMNEVIKLQSKNSALFKTNIAQRSKVKEMKTKLQEKDVQLQSSSMKIRELTEKIEQLKDLTVVDVVHSITQQAKPVIQHGQTEVQIKESEIFLDVVHKIMQDAKNVEEGQQIEAIVLDNVEKEGKKRKWCSEMRKQS